MFAAARGGWPDKRLVVAFQPHRYSRTRDLFDEFAAVLSSVDVLVLTEVYPAGEAPIAGADAKSLARAIRARGRIDPIVVGGAGDLAGVLPDVLNDGDLLLMMGAGDIGHAAQQIAAQWLQRCIQRSIQRSSASERHAVRDRRAVNDPAVFGRVAVLMGGTSAEREVSLDSGRNVLEALRSRGVDAFAVDGIPALIDAIRAGSVDRVFNILHGNKGGGEDGVLQGLCEALGVPYTGSGVLGSALTMDKIRTKQVWLSEGLPTPRYARLAPGADVHAAARELGLPVFIKPSSEGSSVGVSRVLVDADLDAAVEHAARYPGELLMEQLISGEELTVPVLLIGRRARRAAVDPHRPQGRVVRLPREVHRRRHPVPVPGPGRRRGRRDSPHRAGRVRLRRLPWLGPRRLHARPRDRPALPARGQHRAGHDQPFAGAQGRAPGRHRVRRAVLARARVEPGPGRRADRGRCDGVNAMLRLVGWILALALVVLPVVAVLNGWIGAEPVAAEEAARRPASSSAWMRRCCSKTLMPYAQRGFFAVDLAAAQDAVSKLPWVERARSAQALARRAAKCTVVEHRPFARWGKDLLLSRAGQAVPGQGRSTCPQGLPQFGGPHARVADVVELYNESRAHVRADRPGRARSRSSTRAAAGRSASTTARRSWSAAAKRAPGWAASCA